MKIFVDTANLDEIKAAMDTGWVDGVTTNPSLLAKEPKGKFEEHIGKIIRVLRQYERDDEFILSKKNFKHLSVEVFSKDPDEILEQAERFRDEFGYEALSVKVQVGWQELSVIRKLADSEISVNCTACMTVSQAMWAAKAGAKYASLFWGRIRDASPSVLKDKIRQGGGSQVLHAQLANSELMLSCGAVTEADFDPASVVSRTRAIFDREQFQSEIIVGSIRTIWDVRDAMLAGAHIVTVPFKFFKEFHLMASHYKTDEVIWQFITEFKEWIKKAE